MKFIFLKYLNWLNLFIDIFFQILSPDRMKKMQEKLFNNASSTEVQSFAISRNCDIYYTRQIIFTTLLISLKIAMLACVYFIYLFKESQ